MINVQLAHEKSHFEHRSGNNSNLGENVAHAHPSVTEFRQPLQVQSHLEMPGILVQLGHIQRT